jgi:hypothetical protein
MYIKRKTIYVFSHLSDECAIKIFFLFLLSESKKHNIIFTLKYQNIVCHFNYAIYDLHILNFIVYARKETIKRYKEHSFLFSQVNSNKKDVEL